MRGFCGSLRGSRAASDYAKHCMALLSFMSYKMVGDEAPRLHALLTILRFCFLLWSNAHHRYQYRWAATKIFFYFNVAYIIYHFKDIDLATDLI